MSTSIVACYWFRGASASELALQVAPLLQASGFGSSDSSEGIPLKEEQSAYWASLTHRASGVDAWVSVEAVTPSQGEGGLLVTLKAGSAQFKSPGRRESYPAAGVLFEAAALAFYESSSAVYGYVTPVDFLPEDRMNLPVQRLREARVLEWQAAREHTLLSLYAINFLSEAILERYPLLDDADAALVRRVRLRDDGMMLALSRCFIWNEMVIAGDFASSLGISQAWQGGDGLLGKPA